MGILSWLKGVFNNMFKTDAKKQFKTNIIISDRMETEIKKWIDIVSGVPWWVNKDEGIETINFAKFITSDIAKKICLDIDINVSGSVRAEYLKNTVNALKKVLRDKVEDACASGGIMFKPNGNSDINNCIDYIMTTDFLVTETNSNGGILGAIFFDYIVKENKYYTRMEWQRFEGDKYIITNKAFKSDRENVLGKEINLNSISEWESIQPEVSIENVERPLFAYYKMPYNNNIDFKSPLGLSVFANAIKELKNIDIAWSRKSEEVEDSRHITFIDQTTMKMAENLNIKLPRFVKGLDMGVDKDNVIHEHVATILTDERIKDINSNLNMLATKAGFSQGAWVLDGHTGMMTATQVESDDRETIETIKDMRDNLKDTLEHLIYAVSKYADIYEYAPVGKYETSYGFGDLTYNWEEDRARHWGYVQANKYPVWKYYMKFEGMSEEEAKECIREAQNEMPEAKDNLFDSE